MKTSKPTTCKICGSDLTTLPMHCQYNLLCADHYRAWQKEYQRKRRALGNCECVTCGKKVGKNSPVKYKCKKCHDDYWKTKNQWQQSKLIE